LGPLGQKYVEAVLKGTRDKQKSDVDYVYGVYLNKDGLMDLAINVSTWMMQTT